MDELETRTMRRIVRFLLQYRDAIHHPDPEAVVTLGLAVVGFSIRELVLMETITDVWSPLLPKTDDQLVRELASMMLRYLEIETGTESTASSQKTKSPRPLPGLDEHRNEN